MTRPWTAKPQPRAAAKVAEKVALDPAIAKALEQVGVEEALFTQVPDAEPLFTVAPTEGLKLSGGPGGLQLGGGGLRLSGRGGGKGGGGLWTPKGGGLWGDDSEGRRRAQEITTRRIIIPPPPKIQEPEGDWRGYWMPIYDYLGAFPFAQDELWEHGQLLDFNRARYNLGVHCASEETWRYIRDGTHQPNEDDVCMEHSLKATEVTGLDEILENEYAYSGLGFEGHEEWEELQALLVEMRKEAFERVEELLDLASNLDQFFAVAGVPFELFVLLPERVRHQVLVSSIRESRDNPNMLASAWADLTVTTWPEEFGHVGARAFELYQEMHMYGWVPQLPVHAVCFLDKGPTSRIDDYGDLQLAGRYVVTKIGYHSALKSKQYHTDGFWGWRVLYVESEEAWLDRAREEGLVAAMSGLV